MFSLISAFRKNNMFFAIIFHIVFLNLVFAQPNRNAPPELPPPPDLNLPEIDEFTLQNGLKVFFMEKSDVPLIHLNVVIKAGLVDDPEDKISLANLTADMLDEGAAEKTSLEIADEIDFLGASVSVSSGYHTTGISLHTPMSKFDEALNIYKDIILNPDFPEKELERLKKEKINLHMQRYDQPTSIASIMFNRTLYNDLHEYGRINYLDISAIQNFTVKDIRSFYNEFFGSDNSFIVAVGDIKPDLLKEKLEKTFGKWEKGKSNETELKKAEQVNKRIVHLVDKPGSEQSVIYIGRIGAERKTDDYFPVLVMNTILGGSFSSRLNQNLREQHGYTYGARTVFHFRHSAGPFIAYASVYTDVTDKALKEFFNELDSITVSITDEELNRAKNYTALKFPQNFQTTAAIANRIEELVTYNLPENYFTNYIDKILSVSKDEVKKAAEKYIIPDEMIVVVVGDSAKIEEGINSLNLGEIKKYTVEDILGKIPDYDK